jgi:hypothetical protein
MAHLETMIEGAEVACRTRLPKNPRSQRVTPSLINTHAAAPHFSHFIHFTSDQLPSSSLRHLHHFHYYCSRKSESLHPFLRKLCDYYKVSICNLHPNSVLAVSIFITLCKSYLGIQPHFNLWWHFFCLKKKGGAGGSKIARGVYLNLHDGMQAEYLNVPLSSSTRDWYKKWL